jgi:hypothetical protein
MKSLAEGFDEINRGLEPKCDRAFEKLAESTGAQAPPPRIK